MQTYLQIQGSIDTLALLSPVPLAPLPFQPLPQIYWLISFWIPLFLSRMQFTAQYLTVCISFAAQYRRRRFSTLTEVFFYAVPVWM